MKDRGLNNWTLTQSINAENSSFLNMDILWIKRGKAKCPIPVVGCVGGGEGGREVTGSLPMYRRRSWPQTHRDMTASAS